MGLFDFLRADRSEANAPTGTVAKPWDDPTPPTSCAPRAAAAGTRQSINALALPAGTGLPDPARPGEWFCWVSDDPVDLDELWPRLVAAYPTSGWWPVVVTDEDGTPDAIRDGLFAGPGSVVSSLHPYPELVRRRVDEVTRALGPGTPDEAWKYVAAPPATATNPGQLRTRTEFSWAHLLLVPVERPADLLAQLGWQGGRARGIETGDLLVAMRHWEDAFGAALVQLASDFALVQIAAPPTSADQQALLLREFNAFAPAAGPDDGTVADYSSMIADHQRWPLNWW